MRRRARGDSGGDTGFVLPWVALMLVVLLGIAGIAVDVGNWYFVAGKAQNAADSGSLAGAVFLPGNLPLGQTIGVDTAEANGFTLPSDTIAAAAGSRPNQLRVTVARQVNNFFLGFLGIPTTSIQRTAVAEFQGPIPMGSPENHLGTDPEDSHDPDYWINVAGPNATKVSGDRFTAKICPTSVSNCTSGTPNNSEYSPDGYAFGLRVNAIQAGKPLVFQVFDPVFAYVGDHCGDVTWPTAAELTALQAMTPGGSPPAGFYSDASTRYAPGDSGAAANWCTGDQHIQGRDMITSFIVRKPDDSPFNDFDNPVVNITDSCEPVQTRAFAQGGTGNPLMSQLLHPTDGIADTEAVYNTSDNFDANGLTFIETFRRWTTVCTIPAGSLDLVTGDYIIQIRTNAAYGSPEVYSASINTGGHNRMALRAGFQSSGGALSGAAVNLYGNGKLPIYANGTSSATTFYLARVLPSGGDRVLQVPLFDMGDASVAGTLELVGPNGSNWSNCSFARDWTTTVPSATCTLTAVSSGNGYNGRITTIIAPIPASYTCTPSTATDCWFKIRATFGGGVQDTTTWQAYIQGDPVHLIE